jgi:hypothetical protein
MLQQRDAAWVAADRLLQRHGEEPAVLENIAQWHLGQRRWGRAAELFERALATGHARPGTAEMLAESLRLLQLEVEGTPGADGKAGEQDAGAVPR